MKLNERLMLMADQIEKGETMADIGTDHGFLPIYLYLNGICSKVILSDISRGSLDKAADNCRKMAPGLSFDLRLGDGIEVLDAGEVDDVVIAGMGGRLISEIMKKDLEHSLSFARYILQPRNNEGRLRYELMSAGFEIKKDMIVKEGKFFCTVLVCEPAIESPSVVTPYDESPWIYDYPCALTQKRSETAFGYMLNEYTRLITIGEKKSRSRYKDKNKSYEFEMRKERLGYLLSEYRKKYLQEGSKIR